MKRKMLLIPLVLLLAISLVAIGCPAPAPPAPAPPVAPTPKPPAPAPPKPAPAPETYRYKMGAVRSTSSAFAFCVATAELINKNVPEVEVTVVETGATHDDMARLVAGTIDFAVDDCVDAMVMLHYGVGREEYVGKPWDKVRVWITYTNAPNYFCVVDEGPFTKIKGIKDLHGQLFNAGIPGSSTNYDTTTMFKKLGIEPNWYKGSVGDAKEACKDLACCGFVKSCPKFDILDSLFLDLASVRKIRILSFTEDELKVALATVPGLSRVECPANAIEVISPHPPLLSWGFLLSSCLTTDIPQEIGYKMSKAVLDNWDDICAVYPASKFYNPIKDNIRDVDAIPGPACPFHAGLVQYYEELGIKVPAKLVPPEYERK